MRQEPTALEDIWLTRAKRLLALATTGLHYNQDLFDRERYEEMADMASEMLADLSQVPISRIQHLVPDYAAGYAPQP